MAPRIEIAGFRDFGILEQAWRALEADAAPFSFFQSWTWVGCLAEERFPDPVLVRATEAGQVVGLALFNRRGGSLHLGESGEAGHDCIYVEHNGPLVAAGTAQDLPGLMLRAAWSMRGIGRVVLSGVPSALLAAAGGISGRDRQDEAPFVDLAAIGPGKEGLLAALSANTRGQVRRSVRHFEAMGALSLARPSSEVEEAAWFAELASLHAARWQRSGLAGAFAEPFMARFHGALLPRARGRGEADLWRLAAGAETLGYLYNFRHRGTVYAYQSGLREFPGTAQARPGLVGHWLAITEAKAAGLGRYDFLAGPARYKLSLATASAPLAWGERVQAASPAGVIALGRGLVRQLRDRWVVGRGGST